MTQHKHIQDWSMTQQNKLITENIAKSFQLQQSKTPILYSRPKIDKTGNPRRPVVRSINCHTDTIQSMLILSDCSWTRTHNCLVHKRKYNHLAKTSLFFK